MSQGAVLSDDGEYRYHLWRTVSHFNEGRVLFVMLNPSTADAKEDDPTIRRCMNLVRQWGFARLDVVNLFAYRATKPSELSDVRDPVGPENDTHIIETAIHCARVIAAWGVHGGESPRAKEVLELLDGYLIRCLGTTKSGYPRHPLYIKDRTSPVPYDYGD
jgi:hypothetical protein